MKNSDDSASLNQKILIFGASRGLGRAILVELLREDPAAKFFCVSRRWTPLPYEKSASEEKNNSRIKFVAYDLSQPLALEFLDQLKEFSPTKVIYCVGGGPYGRFERKEWKDHQWALQVSFLSLAQLLHYCMSQLPQVNQVVVIGSAIAEEHADPMAASYAAAKHALRGLLSSIQSERGTHDESFNNMNKGTELDLRLYSPGYIDTDMLPKKAKPRQEGVRIFSSEELAKDLVLWIQQKDSEWHRVVRSL